MRACTVPANEHWFNTSITLVAGQTYQLNAQGEWFDDKIKSGPDGYQLEGNVDPKFWPVFGLVEPLRPVNSGDTWFELVGKLGNEIFIIGSSNTYTATTDGELLCTANDCPFMYWNNTGNLELTVTP